jgi:hypothetical protein
MRTIFDFVSLDEKFYVLLVPGTFFLLELVNWLTNDSLSIVPVPTYYERIDKLLVSNVFAIDLSLPLRSRKEEMHSSELSFSYSLKREIGMLISEVTSAFFYAMDVLGEVFRSSSAIVMEDIRKGELFPSYVGVNYKTAFHNSVYYLEYFVFSRPISWLYTTYYFDVGGSIKWAFKHKILHHYEIFRGKRGVNRVWGFILKRECFRARECSFMGVLIQNRWYRPRTFKCASHYFDVMLDKKPNYYLAPPSYFYFVNYWFDFLVSVWLNTLCLNAHNLLFGSFLLDPPTHAYIERRFFHKYDIIWAFSGVDHHYNRSTLFKIGVVAYTAWKLSFDINDDLFAE